VSADAFKSGFLTELARRGFIHQVSEPELLDAAAREPIVAYIGFDCTRPSLHIGSLVQIMMLHWLQRHGHRPIVVMGGGTTRIGDPAGKDEERPILEASQIEANKAGIARIFSRFLEFGPGKAIMVDNAEWLDRLGYIDFLRDVGKHFSVNRMLTFEAVKRRLDMHSELSFLAFNYMILQAYDFTELYKRYGCILQMGGSDQWGNIVNGIELGRRLYKAQLFALTSPLITTSSGEKMGKTAASGTVWLDAEQTSPYDFWQFWRNTDDADVGRFLHLFTTLPLEEITALAALPAERMNDAKKVLATEVTALVHGREAAQKAAETARLVFEEGVAAEDLPAVEMPRGELEKGIGVLTAFVRAGLAKSVGEARRLVANRALRVNDELVTEPTAELSAQHLAQGAIKLSLGRKRHVLLRAT
jgi:tyrosyl-tRNA synthetase